ncbi:hypothetical protein [uncultured Sphingomonas sp.]|uniref:hypothetical protein n=1 Tax=uncultured Sphingomonas sp. TaxID=158754 RepID=UPI0030D8D1BA
MGIFDRIGEWFSRIEWGGSDSSFRSSDNYTHINPATGLPMTGSGTSGLDVAGNPFGTDLHRWHDDQASGAFHDSSSPADWHHTSAAGGYDPSRGW